MKEVETQFGTDRSKLSALVIPIPVSRIERISLSEDGRRQANGCIENIG